jgi:outer membrane receptor protein involved in Fe transport
MTPHDSIYGYVQTLDQSTGDLTPRYDPNVIATDYRAKETQEPFVGIGYHHEWSPGVHTLFLANRLQDTFNFKNFTQPSILLNRPDDPSGVPYLAVAVDMTMNEHYTNQLEIYSMELQQIWELAAHTTIAGARVQYGHFDTAVYGDNPSVNVVSYFPGPTDPTLQQDVSSLFKRISFYGYHQWQIFEPLQLIAGVTYDRLAFSENFLTAPISNQETRPSQVSPKAGLIWRPAKDTAVRFAYTRSLSGASLDQSDQLEPSQVAGFIQSYRSIIPEAIVGGTSGAQFETYDVILEQKFSTGTYLSLSGEMLNSTVHRVAGAFDYLIDELPLPTPSGVREKLDYQEMSAQFTANQLLGREWSLGARYRISQANLLDDFVDIPDKLPLIYSFSLQPRQRTKALLNQLDLTANYNHPCGFFATGGAQWFGQSNYGYAPAEPGDSFWQLNVYAGYRSPRRRMELTVGLLNLAGQDYRLNPLNYYNELPHQRTVSMRLRFNF